MNPSEAFGCPVKKIQPERILALLQIRKLNSVSTEIYPVYVVDKETEFTFPKWTIKAAESNDRFVIGYSEKNYSHWEEYLPDEVPYDIYVPEKFSFFITDGF